MTTGTEPRLPSTRTRHRQAERGGRCGDFNQAKTKATGNRHQAETKAKTKTIGDDFHQAGTKAGDESRGIGDDFHQAETKANTKTKTKTKTKGNKNLQAETRTKGKMRGRGRQ